MKNTTLSPNKIEKIKSIVCAIIGIAIIITGIITISASDSHTGHSGGVSRASTSIEFGADFYTTSAEYTGLAANSVVDTFELLQNCFGMAFIFAGILLVCNHVCKLLCLPCDSKNAEAITEEIEEEPVTTEISAE